MKNLVKLLFIYGIIVSSIAVIFSVFINFILLMFSFGNALPGEGEVTPMLVKIVVMLLLLTVLMLINFAIFKLLGVGGAAVAGKASFFSKPGHVIGGWGDLLKRGLSRSASGVSNAWRWGKGDGFKNWARSTWSRARNNAIGNAKNGLNDKSPAELFLASRAMSRMGLPGLGKVLKAKSLYDFVSKPPKEDEKANTGEVSKPEGKKEEDQKQPKPEEVKKKEKLTDADRDKLSRAKKYQEEEDAEYNRLSKRIEDPNRTEGKIAKDLKRMGELEEKKRRREEYLEKKQLLPYYRKDHNEEVNPVSPSNPEAEEHLDKSEEKVTTGNGKPGIFNRVKNMFTKVTGVNASNSPVEVAKTSEEGINAEKAYDMSHGKDLPVIDEKVAEEYKQKAETHNAKVAALQPGMNQGHYDHISDDHEELENFRKNLGEEALKNRESASRMSQVLARGDSIHGVSLNPETLKKYNLQEGSGIDERSLEAQDRLRYVLGMGEDNPTKRAKLDEITDQHGNSVTDELLEMDKEHSLGGHINPVVVPDEEGNPVVVRDELGAIMLHDDETGGRAREVEDKVYATRYKEAKQQVENDAETKASKAAEGMSASVQSSEDERVEQQTPGAPMRETENSAPAQTSNNSQHDARDYAGVNAANVSQGERVAETVERGNTQQQSNEQAMNTPVDNSAETPQERRDNDNSNSSQSSAQTQPQPQASSTSSQTPMSDQEKRQRETYAKMAQSIVDTRSKGESVYSDNVVDKSRDFTRDLIREAMSDDYNIGNPDSLKISDSLAKANIQYFREANEGNLSEEDKEKYRRRLSMGIVREATSKAPKGEKEKIIANRDGIRSKIEAALRKSLEYDFNKENEDAKQAESFDGGNTGEIKREDKQ